MDLSCEFGFSSSKFCLHCSRKLKIIVSGLTFPLVHKFLHQTLIFSFDSINYQFILCFCLLMYEMVFFFFCRQGAAPDEACMASAFGMCGWLGFA